MPNISQIKLPNGTTYDINALTLGGETPSDFHDYDNLTNTPETIVLETELVTIGTSQTFDGTKDDQLPTSKAVKNFVEGKGYTTNTGTVTSVAGAGASNSHITVTGGPVTTSGTLTVGVDSGYSIPSTTDQAAWSAKQNALATQTAYSAKGTAKKVAQISTNSLGQVTSISEVDITPEFSSVLNRYQSIIEWGGPVRTGAVSPIEAATIDELGHNKFSFLSANSIAIQYSRDAGSTWTDYPTTNADKRKLVTFGSSEYYIGYRTGSANTVNDRLRVILNSNFAGGNIYCWIQRFLINIGTNGSGGSHVIVETRTIGDYKTSTDNWTTQGTYSISGWSGWNSIPISGAFGGSETQTTQFAQIRLTFYVTSVSSSSTNLRIYGIRAIANPVWQAPSTFSSTGHIYSFDIDQNVTFPASVYANSLYENGTSLANIYAPKPDFESDGGQLVALDSEGKAYEPSGINVSSVITSHQSIKSLDTTATTSQTTSSSEAIKGTGTIVLHKVSKTGSYTDLLDKPTIPQGTVTSVRVQAGTGLSSSQSTAQSTTLNTTISIASGYKLLKPSSVDPDIIEAGDSTTKDIYFYTNQGEQVSLNDVLAYIGYGCLAEGSLITMVDGTKKPIEEVKRGDEVMSYDLTTNEKVPTIVLLNAQQKLDKHIRQNIFSDGSILRTSGEHYVYDTKGSPTSDIQYWTTQNYAYNENMEEIQYCGYFTHDTEGQKTYIILTSNNLYYADGILNSCFPPSKFHWLKQRNVHMPDDVYNATKEELNYLRKGGHRANKHDFLMAVGDLEQRSRAVSDNIEQKKKLLNDTDYQTTKTAEKFMTALFESKTFAEYKQKAKQIYDEDAAEKLAIRKAARDEIIATEKLNEELQNQVDELKRQYGVLTEFDDLTEQEQFKVCNKIGCDNIERYREWLQGGVK